MVRFYVTCPVCHGSRYLDLPAGKGVEKCHACESGSVPIYRCPASFHDAEIARFLRAYTMVSKHGMWPVPGGIEDQSPTFVEAVRLVDGEIAAVQEADRKQRRASGK